MTTTQRREKFRSTFANVPVMMLQGSVGERIKRNFTHQDPPPPLKLAGLYYTEEGHRGLDTVFHDYVQIAVKYGLPMILHPYTKLTTPSMGFSGDSYNPLTGLEEEEAYLSYTDHAKMLESSIVDLSLIHIFTVKIIINQLEIVLRTVNNLISQGRDGGRLPGI